MNALRFKNKDTNTNCSALIQSIRHPQRGRVILFASPKETTDTYTGSDGPWTNLPLLSALVEYNLPAIEVLGIIFDGVFLTAARTPRYGEVRAVLDAAIESGNVFYCPRRAPFTSALKAGDAYKELLSLGLFEALDAHTRPSYFSLLSSVSEREILKSSAGTSSF